MTMVGGFDVHRRQITFDYVDDDGLVRWGQIRPATRATLRCWLGEHCPEGNAEFALEGCTGWRYVVEELAAAGVVAHLGDPAETRGCGVPKSAPRPTGLMLGCCACSVGGPVPRVMDSACACGGGAHPGPVVLHPDGRAPGLAATDPCPVVPPGLPTDSGLVVAGRS